MPYAFENRYLLSRNELMVVSRMTMKELIAYEKHLWEWMKDSPPDIVAILNTIHREVEWRAQDTEFR